MESVFRSVAKAIEQALDALDQQLHRIDEGQQQIQELLAQVQASLTVHRVGPEPKAPNQKWFTPTEAAEILGKRPYTVREWCRLRRINAQKRSTGRGEAEEWEISAEEIERYKNHGLLPMPTNF